MTVPSAMVHEGEFAVVPNPKITFASYTSGDDVPEPVESEPYRFTVFANGGNEYMVLAHHTIAGSLVSHLFANLSIIKQYAG